MSKSGKCAKCGRSTFLYKQCGDCGSMFCSSCGSSSCKNCGGSHVKSI